jgi:hypothetical protein
MSHLVALSKKNFYNWRRTWKGSAGELLCPTALMLLLVWVRTLEGLKYSQPAQNPIDLQRVYFDPTVESNGAWNIDPQASAKVKDFLTFTEYPLITNSNVKGYDGGNYAIEKDYNGPLGFMPPHCVGGMGGRAVSGFPSPIVATLKSDSVIQQKM